MSKHRLEGAVQNYTLKRITIEAIQVTGVLEDNVAIQRWAKNDVIDDEGIQVFLSNYGKTVDVKTFNGVERANIGDYVIRNYQGRYHVCENNVFEALYGGPVRVRV